MGTLTVITSPTVEPVTVAEVKTNASITHSLHDDMIGTLITAARQHGENITKRSLAPQTLEMVFDSFPGWTIKLPRGPVSSVSSVKYYDSDGVEKTLDTSLYETATDSIMARVQPIDGGTWPDANVQLNTARIRYEAGWTADNCPDAIKAWLKARVTGLYLQRDNLSGGYSGNEIKVIERDFIDCLLDPYTVLGV